MRIVIRGAINKGPSKKKLIERLQLQEIVKRSNFFTTEDMEWFRLSNTCLPGLDDPEEPLITLTISDYNANGLGGPWNKPGKHSRFHNLVLSLNAGQKFYREEGMLGSYGIGKMVFARCSRIRTATYYSTFIEDGRQRARLMTSAFLPRHDFRFRILFGACISRVERRRSNIRVLPWRIPMLMKKQNYSDSNQESVRIREQVS